jgi:hypothetical protein
MSRAGPCRLVLDVRTSSSSIVRVQLHHTREAFSNLTRVYSRFPRPSFCAYAN